MKHRPLAPALDYLKPFVPLLIEHEQKLGEEANANKAWHLGRKEFEAVPTLTAHEPISGAHSQGGSLHELHDKCNAPERQPGQTITTT